MHAEIEFGYDAEIASSASNSEEQLPGQMGSMDHSRPKSGVGLTSSFTSLLAGTVRTSARTTVTSMMLSMVRPNLPDRLPIPPPRVNLLHQPWNLITSVCSTHPATPVWSLALEGDVFRAGHT